LQERFVRFEDASRMEPLDRSEYPTRLRRLHDPEEDELRGRTPEELVQMVWVLTLQAWAFKEGTLDEPRLRRDVVRVVRGKG
jgi:hypothetical protein